MLAAKAAAHSLSARRGGPCKSLNLKACGLWAFIGAPPLQKQASDGRHIKKSPALRAELQILAEREGFEPPEARTSTVFKTAVIDHSTISPIAI